LDCVENRFLEIIIIFKKKKGKSMTKLLLIIIILIPLNELYSRAWRPSQIPNGGVFLCSNCHKNSGGGGELNEFGQQVYDFGLTSPEGDVVWSKIFNLDADGDGFTNGEELLDPDGLWTTGDDDPGDVSLVKKPWDKEDFPVSINDVSKYVNQINIFPNPTSNAFNLELFAKSSGNLEILLLDIRGKTVASLKKTYINFGSKNFRFDLSRLNLTEGQYFLGIYINNSASFKVVNIQK
jgi:Secretion system C-terminal sorting domain